MSGEHRHPDYEAQIAEHDIWLTELDARLARLETQPPEPEPEPEPEPPKPVAGNRAKATHGVYPGFGHAIGMAKLAEIEKLLGRKLAFADANLDSDTWTKLSGSSSVFTSTDGWKTRPDVTTCLAVPLRTREDTGSHAADLTAVAGGWKDEAYNRVADRLIASGHDDTILRIGWEGDIGVPGTVGYPWSFTLQGSHVEYVQAFRHVAQLFKAKCPRFRVDYQGNGPWSTINPATKTPCGDSAYPGDDVVDIIGVDIYDRDEWPTRQLDLDYCRDLAKRHRKPMSVPEWGIWLPSNGDNPAFIHNMADWLETAPATGPASLAYNCYFWGEKRSTLDAAPKSKAAWVERFS